MSTIEKDIRDLLDGGARAVIVSPDWPTGALMTAPVAMGQSVVNLKTELTSHMDELPFTDEYLANLRDYCTARLEARALARGTPDGLVLATGSGWVITDARQFQTEAAVAQHQRSKP